MHDPLYRPQKNKKGILDLVVKLEWKELREVNMNFESLFLFDSDINDRPLS